jgi:hypothetical protein
MAKVLLCFIALGMVEASLWDKVKDSILGKNKTEEVEQEKKEETLEKKELVPAFWGKIAEKAKENFIQYSDVAKPQDVLASSKIVIGACGDETHAMQVRDAHFDTELLEVHVGGHLKRDISGGKVTMDLKLGKPLATMTKADIMKRKIAWVASGKHYDEEPLCKHFDRYGQSCPVEAGEHEMRFGFNRLPAAVIAGGYDMTVKAFDAEGAPVLCVKGSLEVSLGGNGEIFRRLQMASTTNGPGYVSGGVGMVSSTSSNLINLGILSLAMLAAFAAW